MAMGSSPLSIGEEYTMVIENDLVTFNPLYVGSAPIGSNQADAVWQIFRISYDVNNMPTNIEWANGSSAFVFVWNDRAGYAYS